MNQQKKWLWRKPETMVDWIVIVFSSILFYMVLSNAGYVLGLLEKFMTILTPFAAGIVIAYIINPVVDWAHKYICRENILIAMENNDLNNARAKALLKSSTPLADVYNKYASWEHSRQQEEIWNAVEARSGEVLRAEFAAAQRSER